MSLSLHGQWTIDKCVILIDKIGPVRRRLWTSPTSTSHIIIVWFGCRGWACYEGNSSLLGVLDLLKAGKPGMESQDNTWCASFTFALPSSRIRTVTQSLEFAAYRIDDPEFCRRIGEKAGPQQSQTVSVFCSIFISKLMTLPSRLQHDKWRAVQWISHFIIRKHSAALFSKNK